MFHLLQIAFHFLSWQWMESKSMTYIIQKKQDKMTEMARSIQSFPSTRAYSTSFSAGKYSGWGIGSVMKFSSILYFQFTQKIHLHSPHCALLTSGQSGCCEVVLNWRLSGFVFCCYFELVPTSALEVTKDEIIFVGIGAGSVWRNDRPTNIPERPVFNGEVWYWAPAIVPRRQ